jgi:hypothetical protein
MSHSHREKYFTKMIIGFASLISCVLVIFYAIFETSRKGDWYFWAIVAAFLLCGGVYFALAAFTHKIKSDFSKRQKAREEQKVS